MDDNSLWDLHNSSRHMKAQFSNNCFIIQNYFQVLNKLTCTSSWTFFKTMYITPYAVCHDGHRAYYTVAYPIFFRQVLSVCSLKLRLPFLVPIFKYQFSKLISFCFLNAPINVKPQGGGGAGRPGWKGYVFYNLT